VSDTLNLPAATAPSPNRWAEVRVAEQVTRYVRRGVGHPVVVLRAGAGDAELWPALVETMIAAHCRVILPEVPDAAAGFASWIRGFLDGVGLPPITLIAVGHFCVPALELALLDAERLARLVLVPCGRAEETGLAGALSTTARAGSPLPILVVRRECPATEALALVERFVAGESGSLAAGV
jgi:hypothetical protein